MEHDPNGEEQQEFGPLVGIIIIVGLLVAGALYFLFMNVERPGDTGGATAQETNR